MHLANRCFRWFAAMSIFLLASCGSGGGGSADSGGGVTPPPPAAGSCASAYPPNFSFVTGTANPAQAAAGKPTKGVNFTDTAFGTCAVRVTNHAGEAPQDFARNDYSRRQAFNADSSLLLVYANNGFWHVYNAINYAYLKQLNGPAGDAEPQWHPTDPNILYYLPTNGVGMQVLELNVSANTNRVVGDLESRLRARWPNAGAAWTKSEGSPSADARYWCFMVDSVSGSSFDTVGVVTWDRVNDQILGFYNTNGDRPDHVSMSPSGNYCVISGDGPRGTVALARDLNPASLRQLLPKSEHSDIALAANGHDVYVSVDYQSAQGDVFMIDLTNGDRTVLFPTYINGTATALHISGKGFHKPGWIVMSTYAANKNGQSMTSGFEWLHRKVMAVELKSGPRVYQLAHHHSADLNYWDEPQASVNRDFTKILFNSNWESSNFLDVDAYMVELPAGLIQ